MKQQFLATILFAAVMGHAHAQSDVFLCVDERGGKEYKNTGATKGCKRMDLPNVISIPAPASKASVTQTAAAKTSSSPSEFPKVDRDTQKTRDSDRRQILQDEMGSEERKLSLLKVEFKNGEPDRNGNERNYAKYLERVETLKEDMGRSEKNIEALKRELASTK